MKEMIMKLGCLRESNRESGIIDFLLLYCCPELYIDLFKKFILC